MRRRYTVVRQHDEAGCGVAALAMVCLYYGKQVTQTMLHDICGTTRDGTSIKGLCGAAERLGLKAVPLFFEYDHFIGSKELRFPLICMTVSSEGLGHYVVVTRISNKGVDILDPAIGKRRETKESFRKEYSGRLILLAPDSDFTTAGSDDRRNLIWTFIDMLKPHTGLFATVIVIGFVLTLLGIGLSIFYRILIDDIIGNSLEEQVTAFFIFYLFINLVNVALGTIRQHAIIYLSQKVTIRMMTGYFSHILNLPMRFFGTRKRGDIITRYQDTGTVVSVMSEIVLTVIIDIVFAVVSAFFLYSISPKLFVVTVLMLAVSAILIYVFLPSYRRLNRESMVAESNLNSNIIESLSNIETVKTNSSEAIILDKMENRLVDSLRIAFRAGVLGNVQGTLSSILSAVGGIGMMWLGTVSILEGEMTLGILMSFYSLSDFFTGPIGRFIGLQIQLQEADIALKRLAEIFDVKEESQQRSGGLKPETLRGDISLKDVTFRYGSERPVLRDVNLTVREGERIAIIGESGSGKSTLGKIIAGLWQPTEGSVSIAGFDVLNLDVSHMRSRIAYVQQNTELFSGRISDNLRLAKDDATVEEMFDACQRAQCMPFISKMPGRFETYLEEGGSNLSGGERQRLSIARAFLKDSDILVMDEATSSLDMLVEKKVLDEIFSDPEHRTVIMIAHRLSSVVRCDRIVVMDNGRIVEEGTHESLLAANGSYAELWNSQFVCSDSGPERGCNMCPENSVDALGMGDEDIMEY